METEQAKFWQGEFGKAYSDQATLVDHETWNEAYAERYGIKRTALNELYLQDFPKDFRILEVGCNTGHQLDCLQRQGFNDLYGVEIQWYAVKKAQQRLSKINIVQGSALDIPFKDNFFDLVFTNELLIHIAPENLLKVMIEIERCSRGYIMGLERYATEMAEINYQGRESFIWKADYCGIYQRHFRDLELIRQDILPYISKKDKGKQDSMFLLKKTRRRFHGTVIISDEL